MTDLKPGHVQIRVDDLDLTTREGRDAAGWLAAMALSAQAAGDHPEAERPKTVGDGCECWVTPEHTWTTHYGAVEPGSQVQYNPACPKHGESKPATTTVELPCPGCGTTLTRTATVWWRVATSQYAIVWERDPSEFHDCQPDEPTTFGAQVTVTRPDGEVEKWLRGDDGSEPWISENTLWWSWKDLCERGVVTLGWPQNATDGNLPAQ